MYNSFSQSIMKKYGWTEGKGLGKDSQGIVNPIKATLKFDSHGISYKEIDSELSSKWSNIYTAAVSNIQITEDNSISILKSSTNKDKLDSIGVKVLYQNFVKSAMYMKDGIEIKEENKNTKSKKRKLVLNEEEERHLAKKSKKKKSKSKVDELLQPEIPNYNKAKAEKAETKSLSNDLDRKNIQFDNDNVSNNDQVKIKKRKTKCLSDNLAQEECTLDETPAIHKRKKSKKKCLSNDTEQEHGKLDGACESDKPENKKAKKKHLPKEDVQSNVELKVNENGEKKSKKKSKKSIENEGPISLAERHTSSIPNSTFMTCYPAARCGMGISGKLARIQKLQEEEKRNSLSIQSFM